jgi:hypothetical protein
MHTWSYSRCWSGESKKGFEEPDKKLRKNQRIRFQREMRANFSNNDSGRLYARVDFHIMKRNENGKIIGPIVLEVDEHQMSTTVWRKRLLAMIQVPKFIQIQRQGAQNLLDPLQCE